ncbi:MAG: cadherin-like beta sandwich domain-containing protein [Nanoarchaeota archaeon]|nr:cadherin-like beta sandwich domain-containing protein [Nanoarchaeota archaeon]
MKTEFFFNPKTEQYTLSVENSVKKIPLKYKPEDSTRRFRTQKILDSLLN